MSSPLLIKICGLKDPLMVDTALEAGADMIGFAHFPPSPRHLELAEIGPLIEHIRAAAADSCQSAVLLVNPDDELIDAVARLQPDFIQLHGKESPERVAGIAQRTGIKTIKALPVGTASDLEIVPSYAASADIILLDGKPPKDATRPGGLGDVFDWSLLEALEPDLNYMLSGGLSPANIQTAIQRVAPPAIDVSSGVERAPGVKDAHMIRQFIELARSA